MSSRNRVPVVVAFASLALPWLAWAQATRPAVETRPATRPATVAVRKDKLTLEIAGEGTLQAADPFEIRVKLKSYAGALTIVSAVPHQSVVKKGDVLLACETNGIAWAVETAENELATAKSALSKAQADAVIAAEAESLALRNAEENVKNAEAGLKWWEDVDGPQMLLSAELAVVQAKNSVDDQTDELEQLRKMYKSEELTNATADIVVKRALRRLEISKIALTMHEQRRDKTKAVEHPIARQRTVDAVTVARQQLASLKLAQAHAAVTRKAALAAARITVEQAERKLADLKSDAECFRIVAPAAGEVIYALVGDGWQTGKKGWIAGDRVNPGALLMRLVTPGKLVLEASIPENQTTLVEPGLKTTISPAALPGVTYETTCGAPVVGVRGNPPAFATQVQFALPAADPRLLPGMKASFRMQAESQPVLVVPTSAVSGGEVSLLKADGTVAKRKVVVGRSDGKQVEVRSGLAEGDQVVVPDGK